MTLSPAFLFLFPGMLFIWHQWAENQGFHEVWIDSYLDDVLFLPLVFGFFRLLKRVISREPDWDIPHAWMINTLLFVSVYFEGILPLFSNRFTSDPLDIIAYTGGMTAYIFARYFVNVPVRNWNFQIVYKL